MMPTKTHLAVGGISSVVVLMTLGLFSVTSLVQAEPNPSTENDKATQTEQQQPEGGARKRILDRDVIITNARLRFTPWPGGQVTVPVNSAPLLIAAVEDERMTANFSGPFIFDSGYKMPEAKSKRESQVAAVSEVVEQLVIATKDHFGQNDRKIVQAEPITTANSRLGQFAYTRIATREGMDEKEVLQVHYLGGVIINDGQHALVWTVDVSMPLEKETSSTWANFRYLVESCTTQLTL